MPLRRISADSIVSVMPVPFSPEIEKFLPLVHHFSGMLGAAAFDFANLILRDLASRAAVTEGTPWQMA
eukprot:6156403-Amphidinium_carterae.1